MNKSSKKHNQIPPEKQRIIDTLSSKYGVSKAEISAMLDSGLALGMSLKAAHIGLRMFLGTHAGGGREYFTVVDIMEVTGESREEVIARIEQAKYDLRASGKDPDQYILSLDPSKLN